jgi:OB-fold nucleic acid binding domain
VLRLEEKHPYRTHHCCEMTTADRDSQVRLAGQIVAVRDLGGLVFLLLHDATGEVQLVTHGAELRSQCQRLKVGWSISVDGRLVSRRPHEVNPNHPAGNVEIQVASIRLVARIRETSLPPAHLARMRLESATRDVLHSRNFTDLGDHLTIPDAVPALERVYRIRTLQVAEHTVAAGYRLSRIAELECSFATLHDLTCLVTDLAVAHGQSLSVHQCGDSGSFGEGGNFPSEGLAMLVGLPSAGHPLFGGQDVRLTALAEPFEGVGDHRLAQSVVLLAGGRVVGTGAVRTTIGAAFRADVVDSLVRSEIMDRKTASDRAGSPAGAWFSLDLDRMVEGSEMATPLDTARASQDLAALLRVSGPGSDPIGFEDLEFSAQRIERWELEASAAMAASRSASANETDARGFGELLNDFAMDDDVCRLLIDLVPGVRDKVERLPEGERFEWIWSILGSESVRAALRDTRAQNMMRMAVELRIITEPRQITYLDTESLESLHRVLDRYPTDGNASVVPLLRQALASSPASFTGLVEALAVGDWSTEDQVTRMLAQDGLSIIRAAADQWLSAPALLPIALRAIHAGVPQRTVAETIRVLGQRIFPNQPIEPHELRATFISASDKRIPELLDVVSESEPDELYIGVLQHFFRPVSLTYAQTRNTLRLTGDCSHHVSSSGLNPGGEHWAAEHRCYQFGVPGSVAGAIRLYLSKNRASVLAKASVGICTAGDLALYQRSDHHHLNITDSVHCVVIGNAQLHVLTIDDRRVLLIRAVNISNAYLATPAARWLVEATLRACVELAAHSGLAEVHLVEGLCFWHLDSSRPQIRAVLDSLRQQLPCHYLDQPFFLFRFGRVDIEINKTYRLWSRHRTDGQPKLHQLLKVVT